jgi:hypothetical protein
MREKQPAILVRLCASAINTVNSYLFGAGRMPQFRVDSLDDPDGNRIPDDEIDPSDQEEIDNINRAIAEIRKKTKLDQKLLELGRNGLMHGSVGIAGHQLSTGRMWSEVLELSDVKVKFAREDQEVADANNLEDDDIIELDEYWLSASEDLAGNVTYFVNRRFWDVDKTIDYQPADLGDEVPEDLDVEALSWSVENEAVHSLGFVPVVWIQNLRVADALDGAPLISEAEQGLEDEYNYTLSQLGIGIRYNQEPQLVFLNVANMPDPNNTDQTIPAIRRGSQDSLVIESEGVPNTPPADVRLLEMTGAGQAAAVEYLTMLRQMFSQVTRVIEHDPERAVGALSGVAIERLMQPMVSLVGALRQTYGAGLARWFELMLRVQGIEFAGNVNVHWPEVIQPTAQDLQTIITPLIQLWTNDLIDIETLITILSPFYAVEDVRKYVEKLGAQQSASNLPPN